MAVAVSKTSKSESGLMPPWPVGDQPAYGAIRSNPSNPLNPSSPFVADASPVEPRRADPYAEPPAHAVALLHVLHEPFMLFMFRSSKAAAAR